MIKDFFKTENIFLIFCLVWGVLFLLVNPPFQSPDEPEHLFKMWGYTEGSYNHKIKDGWAGQVLPESFAAMYKVYDAYRMSNNPVPFDVTLKASMLPLDKNNTEFLRFTPSSYTPFSYFPSFIVLWILKILNAAPLFMMYVLRFCSLLVYLALCYFAIKITPVKKMLFFICAMLPVCVYQAASVSTDGVTFGVILLFLAYTFRLAFDDNVEKISRKSFLFWAGLVVLIGILKFSYMPLCAVYFLIPQKKFSSKNEYIKNFLITLISGCIVSMAVVLPAMNSDGLIRYNYENNLLPSGEVIKNIILHPVIYMQNIIKTVWHLAYFMSQNMISSIGVTFAMIPASVSYFCWFLIFAGNYFYEEKEEFVRIDLLRKIFIGAGVIISFLIMITAVHIIYQTKGYILGLQGRYLTPLIPFVMLLFTCGFVKIKGVVIKLLIILSVQYVLFVNLMTVINRYY